MTGWAQVRCGYAGSTLGTAWKLSHDLYYLKRRSRLVNLTIVVETLVIAGLDSHRPLRTPASQFLFGQDLGIDLSEDAEGPLPPELRQRGRAPAALPDRVGHGRLRLQAGLVGGGGLQLVRARLRC